MLRTPRQHAMSCPPLIATAMNFVEQLDRLSHPAFQAAIIAALGLLCLCWQCYRLSVGLLAVAAFWLWLCCTPAFAMWLQRGLESQHPSQPAASYAKADAIVVLGGGLLPHADSDWRRSDSRSRSTRVGFGFQLYRDGRAPIILLSGGNHGAERMSEALLQQGVPAHAMQTEQFSRTTHENALNSSQILHRDGLHRILLVTSAMHMPRALKSFRKLGFHVTPATTPSSPSSHEKLIRPRCWPNRRALIQSERCLHEYLGLLAYELRGWA